MRELRREWEPAAGAGGAYERVLEWARERGADLGWAHEDFHLDDKEAVFAAARRGPAAIDADGVVAASRLYTPAHIVDFLLQNTLGRLWLGMRSADRETADWPYMVGQSAVAPAEPRPLRDLRIVDPCCGCGAFLLAAYDMLASLYERERELAAARRIPAAWAVAADEVPAAIVEGNLWGADLDAQAVRLLGDELHARAGAAVTPNLTVPAAPLGSLDRAGVWPGRAFDVVVTNPPYVGFRRLAPEVKEAVRDADPDARSDLAVAFQSRCLDLLADGGMCGTITPAAWLTSRGGLPLRARVLDRGAPLVTAALGQRVFDEAPLLFVGLSVVVRGPRPARFHVLRPRPGSGADGLRDAAAGGGTPVGVDEVAGLGLHPFLPAAPSLFAIARGAPRLGDLFTSFDGVWTGDNGRDVRYWWELPHRADGWEPLSGGQGREPWSGPLRRRIRHAHVSAQPSRAGTVEYARVAGGRLAARLVDGDAASLAGIVTLVPRDEEAAERVEEVLAIFNSRVGAAWLSTLTSGLNFNPGYAAEIPLGREPPGPELRALVRRLVALKGELVRRDPTADAFAGTRAPGTDCELTAAVTAAEASLDELLARHLGIPPGVYATLPAVRASRPRGTALDDHLLAHALRRLGFLWPSQPGPQGPAPGLSVDELAGEIAALLDEGEADLGVDPVRWVRHRLGPYQQSRFRGVPVLLRNGDTVRLLSRSRTGRARTAPARASAASRAAPGT